MKKLIIILLITLPFCIQCGKDSNIDPNDKSPIRFDPGGGDWFPDTGDWFQPCDPDAEVPSTFCKDIEE